MVGAREGGSIQALKETGGGGARCSLYDGTNTGDAGLDG